MINSLRRFYNSLFPLRNCYCKWRLWRKVLFMKNAFAINTYFEGKNALHEQVKVIDCNIGLCTYISSNTKLGNTKVGRFCSIADHVCTGFGTHPTKTFVSTFPSFYYDTKNLPISFMKGKQPTFDVWRYADVNQEYLVEIGNDVWIGSHVLIMDGVKIGDGAIVAAGAVVTKNVEPYSIVAGVPARHVKYRFVKEHIEFLLRIKWWNKDLNWIKKHADDFQNIGTFVGNIDKI